MMGYFSDGTGGTSGQGSYDLCIATDPNNANIVLIGGINGWKSTDGGSNFTCVNMWTSSTYYNKNDAPVVHADKHFLAYQNGSSVLFECNDGGVYKTTDAGANWTDLTDGMAISQIYRIGVSQQTNQEVICGLQDNGTKLFSNGSWYDVKGGDGMECIIDYSNNDTQYGTYVNGSMSRTTSHWGSSTEITQDNEGTPINGLDEKGHWVTPYIIDPDNTNTIYIGLENVWKTTNQGDLWTKISSISSSSKIRSMAIAQSDNNTIYVADPTNIWKTTNGGTNWNSITGSLPTASNDITYIAVKNNDPNTVWVTFGGYDSQRIYKSVNGGTDWTNISSGLPNIPVMSVIQNKLNVTNDEIYVGIDVGIYVKIDNDDWELFSTGLPNVVVTELDIYYDEATPGNSRIRAATFGRGLWESDLLEVIAYDTDASLNQINSPVNLYCSGTTITPEVIITNNGHNALTSLSVNYVIDTESPIVKTWTGNLASGASETISLNSFFKDVDFLFTTYTSNPNGISDENTENDTLSINVVFATSEALPFTEDFEGTTFPPDNWSIENPDENKTWAQNTDAAGNGTSTKAAYVNFFNYSTTGQKDALILPKINLESTTENQITFNVAHNQYDDETDGLEIYISTDCGLTYNATPIYSKYGATLSTGTSTTNFIPSTSGDWRLETIDLSAYDGNVICIKFQSENDYGNNLFIDDIEITGTAQTNPIGGTATAQDEIICEGNTTSIELTDYYGNIQWQQSNDGTTAWSNVTDGSGENSPLYNSAVLISDKYFRAELSRDGYDNAYSNVVHIVVNETPDAGNISFTEDSVCYGSSINISISDYVGTIQWQISSDAITWNNTTEGTDATSNTYTTGVITQVTYFRAKVNNIGCSSDYSDTAKVEIVLLANAGNIAAEETTICEGSETSITADSYLGSIQWQYSDDNTIWSDIPDANTSTYNTGILSNSKYYRTKVTKEYCSSTVYSSSVLINVVNDPIAGTASTTTNNICNGESITITLTDYVGNIQWQSKISGSNWVNINNANSESYALSSLNETTSFRALVGNDYCNSDTSNEITITTHNTPIAGTITASETSICIDESFSISASAYTGNIQWQESINQTDWTNIPDENTANLITQILNNKYFRIAVSTEYCEAVYSENILIQIIPATIANFDFTISNNHVQFNDLSLNSDSVSWVFGDDSISTAQNPIHIYSEIGTYTVTETSYNKCGNNSYSEELTITSVAINNIDNSFSFYLFPNPNNGTFEININQAEKSEYTISIIDAQGKVVYNNQIKIKSDYNETISLDNKSGIYYLILRTNDNEYKSRFIIK